MVFCSRRDPTERDILDIQVTSPLHVVFDFILSCVVCVPSLQMCHSHYGPKPHAIMWGVSTNIHAVNKRVARNAVVNMS